MIFVSGFIMVMKSRLKMAFLKRITFCLAYVAIERKLGRHISSHAGLLPQTHWEEAVFYSNSYTSLSATSTLPCNLPL